MANGTVIPTKIDTPNFASNIVGAGNMMANRAIAEVAVGNYSLKAQEVQAEQILGKLRFGISLLSSITDQETLDLAKEQYLSMMSTEEKPKAQTEIDRLMGNKFDKDRLTKVTTQLNKAYNQWLSLSEKAKTKKYSTVPAGAGVYDEATGEIVASQPEKSTKDYKPEVFVKIGPDGRMVDSQWITPGDPIPAGYVKKEPAGVNIYTGDLTKSTRSKIEQEVIDGIQNSISFQETGKLFKDEYLTLWGKGGNFLAEQADKLGLAGEDQKKLIQERSMWFRQAKADFISFRKWATGVAGGEKEYKELATAFPDPVRNSPEQYKANLASVEDTTKKVLMLNTEFLRSGIDISQPLPVIFKQIENKRLNLGTGKPPGPGVTPVKPDVLNPGQEAEQFMKNLGGK